jgi:hypothetical protein
LASTPKPPCQTFWRRRLAQRDPGLRVRTTTDEIITDLSQRPLVLLDLPQTSADLMTLWHRAYLGRPGFPKTTGGTVRSTTFRIAKLDWIRETRGNRESSVL